MNELSRMERHQSRKKGRGSSQASRKKSNAASQGSKSNSKKTPENRKSPASTGVPSRSRKSAAETAVPTRKKTTSQVPAGMKQASSQTNKGKTVQRSTPSRSNRYPSYRLQMSKWFVNSLIIIFILLMAGLLIWGLIGAPPLGELI